MSPMVDWFVGADPAVQAALVGNAGIAVAAIVTVVGTAIFATRQYSKERQEKAKDRAIAVKNDLLFDSVRGAHSALSALMSLNNLERPVDEIAGELQVALTALTTASAVADVETVARGRDFLNALGPTFMKAVIARRPLDVQQDEIRRIQANLDSQLTENEAILHLQRDAIAGDHTNEARGRAINDMFQAGHAVFSAIAKERDQAISLIEPLHKEYYRNLVKKQLELTPLLLKYVASVRKDVGIDEHGPRAFLDAAFVDPDIVSEAVEAVVGGADN